MTTKLKQSEVKHVREAMLRSQGGKCAMCQGDLSVDDAVMDHSHQTGLVRGIAHRGCNGAEGRIKNALRRAGISDISDVQAFLVNLAAYYKLHEKDQTGLIYASHRTPEEKKAAAAKKRKAKAKKDKK